MEITWLIIVALMLTVFIVLDGFDFGAGIIMLFWAKNDKEKSSILKAIGPFWDGNEVWLIAAGGVLFAVFPLAYASAFSGLYLPLTLVLWMLIFRGIGLELASLVDNKLWKSAWYLSFGLASLMLALLFGIALGNIVRGVNLGGVENGLAKFEVYHFFTPLWNDHFSPTTTHPGVIDWFTVIIGLIAVVTLIIHGANWLILKLSGEFATRLRIVSFRASIFLIFLMAISFIAWIKVKPDAFDNFINHSWLWIFPVFTLSGLGGVLTIKWTTKDWYPFAFSTLFILGAFLSTLAALFPVLIPSTNTLSPDLTIYNSAAEEYGLSMGLIWWPIAITFVIIYFTFLHKKFAGKLDEMDYH